MTGTSPARARATTGEQNIWPQYFGQELRNNIIPAVEGKFSTYAGGDTGEESLITSREHRAFAGLSRGSMTVCRSGLTQNADIIAWFGSIPGHGRSSCHEGGAGGGVCRVSHQLLV